MTSETFTRLTISDEVLHKIKLYRAGLPRLRQIRERIELLRNAQDGADNRKEIAALQREARGISSYKTSLPVLMYQATFEKSLSAKGFEGYWRKQSCAHLNGLYMVDVDHIGDPVQKFGEMLVRYLDENPEAQSLAPDVQCCAFANKYGIVLAHVTPSGEGLRLVAKADTDRGNLADNQLWLSKELGVEPDKACKDASRCSFCPGFNDILFINKEIFNYENKQFEKKYGDQYRKNNSRPTVVAATGNSGNDSEINRNGTAIGGNASKCDRRESNTADNAQEEESGEIDRILSEGYHGKGWDVITGKWFSLNGGVPNRGDRHASMLKMAYDLRYITDFNEEVLSRVLLQSVVGNDLDREGDGEEVRRIARDAIQAQRYREMPRRLQAVLQSCGIQLSNTGKDVEFTRSSSEIDYDYWYNRLNPLLEESVGFREAVRELPDRHKLAGILASGAMFGSYLSRIWWEHFDGKEYRLSFLVYIIGSAASGKSFITELDRLIMAPMVSADKVGREWERKYKEEMKRRNASGKSKGEAPEQQHPVIRYVPSSISNAMLYRRLSDAIDEKCYDSSGSPIHLHCYTLEPELATALRAQQGSWAGKNDIELKSFHNEYAGVDFANDQSVNGVIQINWNQVVSGTHEAMSRKIKPSTILDGLVTRLCLFPMPSNDFAMIERRNIIHDHSRNDYLRSIGIKLDQISGCVGVKKLVDYCYDYEKNLTDEARREEDYCLDYFRKRIPVIMMRYGIVRICLREVDKLLRGEDVEVLDSDLEFVKLIGDFCLSTQIYMFGEQVMQAQQREKELFVPRKRHGKVREMYKALPEELNTETLVKAGYCADTNRASTVLRRWLEDGLVERKDKHNYTKKYKEIPV